MVGSFSGVREGLPLISEPLSPALGAAAPARTNSASTASSQTGVPVCEIPYAADWLDTPETPIIHPLQGALNRMLLEQHLQLQQEHAETNARLRSLEKEFAAMLAAQRTPAPAIRPSVHNAELRRFGNFEGGLARHEYIMNALHNEIRNLTTSVGHVKAARESDDRRLRISHQVRSTDDAKRNTTLAHHEARLDAIEKRLAQLLERANENPAGLQDRVAAMESRLDRTSAELQSVSDSLADTAHELSKLKSAVCDVGNASHDILRRLMSLETAMQRPYYFAPRMAAGPNAYSPVRYGV